jgi:hypothetical protein
MPQSLAEAGRYQSTVIGGNPEEALPPRRIPMWSKSTRKNVAGCLILLVIVASFFVGSSWEVGVILVAATAVLALFVYFLKRPQGRKEI